MKEQKLKVWTNSFLVLDAPIATWMDNFIVAKKAENLSKGTVAFYKYRLNEFLQFCDSKSATNLIQINSNLIREFLFLLEIKGHNAGGIHGYYRTIKAFCKWFEIESDIEDRVEHWKNPISRVKSPKVPEIILDPVKIDDVQKMIAVCPKTLLGLRDKALMIFLLETGVRAAELVALNHSDVSATGDVFVQFGKGRKPRNVYLGVKSRKILRQYLKQRNDSCEALWITDEFTRLSYRGVKMIMRRRAEKAGVPIPSLHSFRRFCAITMLNNGADLFTIQNILGHTDLTILRRYLKQTNRNIKDVFLRTSPIDKLNS